MKTLLRLLAFLSPFRWQIALAILLGSVMIASNMALLGMASYLIAAAALGPLLVTLTLPIYIVRFASVSRSGSRYAERLVSHNATFRLLARLRVWLYTQLERLAPGHLLLFRSGDMLTRLVSDVDELQHLYLRVFSPIIVAIVISILTFGLFTIFSPVLAWTALTFLLATGFGIPLLIGTLSRGLGRQQLALRAELNAQVVDGIQGIQDILAFNHNSTQQTKIATLDARLGQLQRRMAFISGLEQALNDTGMNLAMWTLLILAIPLVSGKAIDGVYLAFLALSILASFEAIQPLGQAFQFLGHSLEAGNRLFKVADTQPMVSEPPNPLPASIQRDHTIEFNHVHFAYDPREGEVINDVSFTLRPGSKIAIVGPSGSGKSTIARLALRFWDATGGTIRLDGHDIRDYSLDDLRDLFGVVSQETYIFTGTIRNNLLLGRFDASENDLMQALEQAQLLEFVRQLPKGLDTWIGQQGLQLSGGERQRLAIARAILKKAPLLILDEATANLDPLTEQALLASLYTLMDDHTTLFITHRLLGMERMDKILVLQSGQITERGTHEQLLQAGGLYRQLFDMQNGIFVLT
ncbi:MAG TPA: thiol reductant ABC exporter subunit CydC [Ktedonobacteraceae bacterium]|jgi:ATP-binding cassette subfamily C protein CydC|nr:thiol reductant ABC exporter subunit CydC [Ktedonobacteraceae bacterium]